MPVASYTKKAIKKYVDNNYEFVKIRLYKGEADILRTRAKEEGISLNQYMRNCLFGEEEVERLKNAQSK